MVKGLNKCGKQGKLPDWYLGQPLVLAAHSEVTVAYMSMWWAMTDFCRLQLAAESQMSSKAGHSEALRLPSDLQEYFAGRLDEIPNLVILATILLIHSYHLGQLHEIII